jgi:hypothetical protein
MGTELDEVCIGRETGWKLNGRCRMIKVSMRVAVGRDEASRTRLDRISAHTADNPAGLSHQTVLAISGKHAVRLRLGSD